ncbi:MAG: hypothetical protein LBR26_16845 [Prevotella sp.]|nr:hypothetical protein [Prevotella sp.]
MLVKPCICPPPATAILAVRGLIGVRTATTGSGSGAARLHFYGSSSGVVASNRTFGFSVRCIQK